MATRNARLLSLWELLRLWLAGGEYAEKRIPELIASLIAKHQDDNALASVISDWLRHNLIDENHTALLFWIARVLKSRGGRFFFAAAEALEALPDIAEEMRRKPEMQRGTAEEQRRRLSAAIADHFTNTFHAVKDRLGHIPIAVGGIVNPSPPSPPSSPSSGGVLAMLSGASTNLTEGASKVLKEGANVAIDSARLVMFLIGAAALWCLFIVMMTIFVPGTMYYVAWISLVVFIAVPAVLMMGGALKEGVGTLVQVASTGFLLFWTSTMELVTFALATGRAVTLQQGMWDLNFMLVVILVFWDRAIMALTQKLIGIPGSELQKMWAKRDGEYSPAEQKANKDYWDRQIFLTGISVSVCVAVNIAVIMILWESQRFNPIDFDLFVIVAAVQLVLGATYVRKNIALWRNGDAGVHMDDNAKRWNDRYYNGAQWTQFLVTTLALIALVGNRFVPDSWGTNVESSTIRAVEVVGNGGSQVLDYAERAVGTPAAAPPAQSVRPAPVETREVPIDRKAQDLADYGGRAACDAAGDTSYPCN